MSGNSKVHPDSILIVRLGAMGDVLHAMPAVAGLRNAHPGARIGWVIEQRWAELLVAQSDGSAAMTGNRPLLDTLHTVDTRKWRKHLLQGATWREMRRATAIMRTQKYEAAIDFQGAIKSAILARTSGAGAIFGFSQPRESAAKLWYSRQVEATTSHVIEQNMQLASAMAGPSIAAQRVELPVSAQAEAWCEAYLRKQGVSRFAILNPGSGWGAKCWPGVRYADVARRLQRVGVRSLVNYGPGEEALAKGVARASEGAAETVSCDLPQLIALTRRSSLFIGGDTGPMHLAAALAVPTVALFGPTDPARNGPFWEPSVVLRSERSVTSYKHVPQADPGLHSITSEAVVEASSRLLGVPIV